MNERIDQIFEQVLDEACADPLYRFAELVRQEEREKCFIKEKENKFQ